LNWSFDEGQNFTSTINLVNNIHEEAPAEELYNTEIQGSLFDANSNPVYSLGRLRVLAKQIKSPPALNTLISRQIIHGWLVNRYKVNKFPAPQYSSGFPEHSILHDDCGDDKGS
jgi:hypothetical protein